MRVNAIVPNLPGPQADADRAFFTDFLGLNPTFDYGGVAGFQSPAAPAAQVHLVAASAVSEQDFPRVAVQVSDVVAAHDEARQRGYAIVYPLTQEAHGPHHFWVATPGGVVINIIEHDA